MIKEKEERKHIQDGQKSKERKTKQKRMRDIYRERGERKRKKEREGERAEQKLSTSKICRYLHFCRFNNETEAAISKLPAQHPLS